MEKNKFGGCIYGIYFGTLLEYGEDVRKEGKNGAVLCYSCIMKRKKTKCSMKYSIV